MTDYAGEPIRISTKSAKNFDGQILLLADVTSVTVEVFNGDLTEVVLEESTMSYLTDEDDVDFGNWAYIWDTTGVNSGTYKAKVVINTIDGLSSWEYKRIRLTRDPHPGP